MRFYKTSVLAAAIAFSSVLWGAPTLIPPPSGQIGNHLEAFTAISLSEPSPAEGLEVTLTSDNSQQLLFATAPDQKGEKTLTLKVAPRRLQTPDFYIQALAGHGPATYTVSAPGYAGAKGAIEIVPSA
ncbi:MAG: hypothetical protein JO061_05675, partial [Acidobacteriaceae bacterium]|nr:hypothetical protein [Acidobacteriaceae bacterium]